MKKNSREENSEKIRTKREQRNKENAAARTHTERRVGKSEIKREKIISFKCIPSYFQGEHLKENYRKTIPKIILI